jgi:TPR repeat protein
MFVTLFLSASASDLYHFPFTPIFDPHPTKPGFLIRNFFDLAHLPTNDSSTPKLREAVSRLKSGERVNETLGDLQALVDAAVPAAAYVLGTIYEFGLFGLPPDDTKARRIYLTGARAGSAECQANLAFFLRYGIGGARDVARAVEHTEMSKGTSIWSILHSSMAHHFGIAQPESCDVGFRELLPLATIVLANSSLFRRFANVGVVRLRGDPMTTVPASRQSVEEWVRIQADAGHPISHMKLGGIYLGRIPREYERARSEYQKAADAGVGDGFLALYFFEQEESADRDVVTTKGQKLLTQALTHGSQEAISELGRLLLMNPNPAQREKGKNLLEKSVKLGSVQGMYLLGLELVKGRPPFQQDIPKAKSFFETCRDSTHFGVLFQLAALSYQKTINHDWSCDKCLSLLLFFTELSFLFDDAKVAFDAVVDRDLRYALRLYQRLADMGSEAAASNAERLCQELQIDPSPWFRLQVKMKSDDALNRLAQTQIARGKVGLGLDTLMKAAESDSAAAFRVGWSIRNQSVVDAQTYFRRAVSLKQRAWLPVALAQLWMFVERLPRAAVECARKERGENMEYIAAELANAHGQMAVVGLLFLLYVLIGLRVRLVR